MRRNGLGDIAKAPAFEPAHRRDGKHGVRLDAAVRNDRIDRIVFSMQKSLEFSVFVAAEIGVDQIVAFDEKVPSLDRKRLDGRREKKQISCYCCS